jgi:hypothetical protein
MHFHRIVSVACSVGLIVGLTCSANAGTLLSIDVADLDVIANGTAEVAVTITATGEALNLAGYEIRITPDAGASSQLRFLEEDEAFLLAANYLFAGNSAALDDGLASSVGSVSTTNLPDDTFVGGDGTADFGDVVLNGEALLVNLRVQHDAGPSDPATTVGDSFSIELVPASGDSVDFSTGGGNTGFLDANFGTLAFGSNSGTVKVVIPEPTSIYLCAIAGMSVLGCLRRSPEQ